MQKGDLEWTNGPAWEIKADHIATDRPPRYRSNGHFGPVSGLMSGINPRSAPSRVTTQWRNADC